MSSINIFWLQWIRLHSFQLLSVVLSCVVMGCSSLTPETHLPEHQRRLLHALKIIEHQQQTQIQLTDLLHFPPFQPIEQLSVSNSDFLTQCVERFNQDTLGDEAALASVHADARLVAVQDGVTGEIRLYRHHQHQAVELGLLYGGIEDMRLRLLQKGLPENATLQEAIDQGIFDIGAIFMVVPDKKAGKSDY